MVLHEPLLKHFCYPHSRGRKIWWHFFLIWHMNQHEACESCRFLMWLRSVSATPHLVHGVLVASLALVPGKALQLGKRGELCCGCVTQFLREIIVFSPLNLPETPATTTHPPIHPPSRRLGGASVISGCHFMRAIIKGSCLVSMETAHFRGGRSEEACARMLRVTMETGATAYISIHCVRLLHQGTFHRIINAQSVCSLLLKITTMSFQVAGSGARRPRRRHRSQGQANFPAN